MPSLSSPLSLQGDMGMGEPLSLLAIYASVETVMGTEEETAKKKKHVVNFQTTETKLVAVYSSQGEDT